MVAIFFLNTFYMKILQNNISISEQSKKHIKKILS